MAHFNIIKEVITQQNNYLVDFNFDDNSVLVTVYENIVGFKGKELYVEHILINKDMKIDSLLKQVKYIINKIEKPINLKTDLAKWDGYITYDMTQEEKNETLEEILAIIIDLVDDVKSLNVREYERLHDLLYKFKGFK